VRKKQNNMIFLKILAFKIIPLQIVIFLLVFLFDLLRETNLINYNGFLREVVLIVNSFFYVSANALIFFYSSLMTNNLNQLYLQNKNSNSRKWLILLKFGIFTSSCFWFLLLFSMVFLKFILGARGASVDGFSIISYFCLALIYSQIYVKFSTKIPKLNKFIIIILFWLLLLISACFSYYTNST